MLHRHDTIHYTDMARERVGSHGLQLGPERFEQLSFFATGESAFVRSQVYELGSLAFKCVLMLT